MNVNTHIKAGPKGTDLLSLRAGDLFRWACESDSAHRHVCICLSNAAGTVLIKDLTDGKIYSRYTTNTSQVDLLDLTDIQAVTR